MVKTFDWIILFEMFTGIIKEIAQIKSVEKKLDKKMLTLRIQSQIFKSGQKGNSFAVNGVCLTQVAYEKNVATFEVVEETLDKTNLDNMQNNQWVHLEEAMHVQSTLDGHIIQGHVDGVAQVLDISPDCLKVKVPSSLKRYLIHKGSVALDGVSLTIAQVEDDELQIALIPYTYQNTLFKTKKRGDFINIEIDMFAKMIFKYLDQIKLSESRL